VAVLAVLLIAIFIAAFWSISYGSSSGGGKEVVMVSLGELRSQRLGTPRRDVEHRLGKGQDALAYGETGPAVEPMDASCVYYAEAGTGNLRDVVQLCFRDGRLSSKRVFAATPGATLG
jgi:hypothetical protein